jgi:predicted acetyltransferase
LLQEEEFRLFIDIVVDAYPGFEIDDRDEVTQRLWTTQQEDPTVAFYGLFRDGIMLGGMRLHDFRMNMLQHQIDAGGVGLLAVHFLHKKEHVAKEMVEYFLRHYRAQGAPMTLLYPFRPDFYKQMGFGYGTKINQYRVEPAALPRGPSKAHVRYLTEDDAQAMLDCYTRYTRRTHGMIGKSLRETERLLKSPKHRVVGFEQGGRIEGYISFTFEKGESFVVNDIHVRYFVYETREALSELLTFLHTQFDQIRRIVFDTQDESFHFLLLDPRNGTPEMIPSVYHESNVQGVGIMYRVVDVRGILGHLVERDFGGQTCRLLLTVEDSFLPENAGSTLLAFENGRLTLLDEGDHDVEMTVDVAEFSSLLVGAVDFKSLYQYGLADLSDAGSVDSVDAIFAVEQKPICMTHF